MTKIKNLDAVWIKITPQGNNTFIFQIRLSHLNIERIKESFEQSISPQSISFLYLISFLETNHTLYLPWHCIRVAPVWPDESVTNQFFSPGSVQLGLTTNDLYRLHLNETSLIISDKNIVYLLWHCVHVAPVWRVASTAA